MYSKTTLIGRLGHDPKLNQVGNSSVLSLSLATTEYYKPQGASESKEITTWHNVQVWGRLGEILKDKLQKGDLVLVEGIYKNRKGQDRHGNDTTYYNLKADIVKRLNSRQRQTVDPRSVPNEEPAQGPAEATPFDPAQPHDESDIPDEEIPF